MILVIFGKSKFAALGVAMGEGIRNFKSAKLRKKIAVGWPGCWPLLISRLKSLYYSSSGPIGGVRSLRKCCAVSGASIV